MKKQTLTLLALLALLIAPMTVSITAQPSELASAKIPFEFQINGKTMPAGRYTVSGASTRGLIVLRGVETRTGAGAIAMAAQAKTPPAQSLLAFHRYGDRYFISAIWVKGRERGYEFPVTRAEREARNEQHLAGAPARLEVVTVVAE